MRGLSSKGFFGFNKTMSFYEELLTPGDALYARGPSRREPGRPDNAGSGAAPLGQLVMYAATGTGGELILTNKTEKQLASRLLRNFIIGVIIWAPLPQASQAQAQSDLAALQHDDNFVGGDLRALSSDAHLTGPDLAATKGDAALGTGCYNVSTVKIDATILKQDASIVSIDLSTLTADIGTVTQDVAAMKNDLANLTASGPPATPGVAAAIAAAGKAIGQAAAKANSEIDQVNADVTQAYSMANGMATGSCSRDGPGHPPAPIRHIASK